MKSKFITKILSILFLFVIIFTVSSCKEEQGFEGVHYDATYQQYNYLKTFKSEKEFKKKIIYKPIRRRHRWEKTKSLGAGTIQEDFNDSEFTDTNTQVAGVKEGDVIKTDGKNIYYVPRYDYWCNYKNKAQIFKFKVNNQGELEKAVEYSEENASIKEIFLTDKYVVCIGYVRNESDLNYSYSYRRYYQTTGLVMVLDKNDFSLVYKYQTGFRFKKHRIIGDKLHIVANKFHLFQGESQIPIIYTKDGVEHKQFLDYRDFYYFESDLNFRGLFAIITIDLKTFEKEERVYTGSPHIIYMNKRHLFTVDYVCRRYEKNKTYRDYTRIIKFDLTKSNLIRYSGFSDIDGYVSNKYWLDEYQGNLRVVTSGWSATKNRLYIISLANIQEKLEIVNLVDEKIGKVDEKVKSVRFDNNIVNIVTFLQTDPLYKIDLTNPLEPKFLNVIEEPGFSVYLHPYGEDYLIGLGYMADEGGRRTGHKVSLYKTTNTKDPLYTHEIPYSSNGYTKIEGIWNPKALLIDEERKLFGFNVHTRFWDSDQKRYMHKFLLFEIANDKLNLREYAKEYDSYLSYTRGIIIRNAEIKRLYTFSNHEAITWDLDKCIALNSINLEVE